MSNITLVTKTRIEHMSEADRSAYEAAAINGRNPMTSLLKFVQGTDSIQQDDHQHADQQLDTNRLTQRELVLI